MNTILLPSARVPQHSYQNADTEELPALNGFHPVSHCYGSLSQLKGHTQNNESCRAAMGSLLTFRGGQLEEGKARETNHKKVVVGSFYCG